VTVDAGTPDPKGGVSDPAPTPTPKPDDSEVKVSAQFKKEALENWKPAAEKVNKLEAELAQERAARQQAEDLARRAYGGGQQATDPRAALVEALRQQAAYDPVAQGVLANMEDTLVARAEVWLANQLLAVPEGKRDNVAKMIRNAGYQMDASAALNVLTDPESKTLHEKLAESQKELERLKNAKPNGVSPASVVPASASVDDGEVQPTMKRSDYLQALNRASSPDATDEDKARARTLKMAVGSNKTKLENE